MIENMLGNGCGRTCPSILGPLLLDHGGTQVKPVLEDSPAATLLFPVNTDTATLANKFTSPHSCTR